MSGEAWVVGDARTELSDRIDLLTCLVESLVECVPELDRAALLNRSMQLYKELRESKKPKKSEPQDRDCDNNFRERLARDRASGKLSSLSVEVED